MHRSVLQVFLIFFFKAHGSAPFKYENRTRNEKSWVVVRGMSSWSDHSWGNYFQNVRESMIVAFLFDIPLCLDWDQPEWLRLNVSALFDLRKAKLCGSIPIIMSRVDMICLKKTSKRFVAFENIS